MNRTIIKIAFIIFFYQTVPVWAEQLTIGVEPFPPLITEKGEGYTIDMLKAIEKMSDIKFEIIVMPYSRAKKYLARRQVDAIAHTPYQHETKDFYKYAQELDWKVDAVLDYYSTNKQNFQNPSQKQLGTPHGNKDFMSALLAIPENQFSVGNLDQLLHRLSLGRIDLFVFERSVTFEKIKQLNIKNLYYHKIMDLPAGIAVAKSKKGNALKKKLEHVLTKINQKDIFAPFFEKAQLPDHGFVSWE